MRIPREIEALRHELGEVPLVAAWAPVAGLRNAPERLGHPEMGDVRPLVPIHQDMIDTHVPVADASAVSVIERTGNLLDNPAAGGESNLDSIIVPEPTLFALLAMGGSLLVGRSRR